MKGWIDPTLLLATLVFLGVLALIIAVAAPDRGAKVDDSQGGFERVEVSSQGEIVTLSGFVGSEKLRAEAQLKAESVPGVKEVRNYIIVDPKASSRTFSILTPEQRQYLRRIIIAISAFVALRLSVITVLSSVALLLFVYMLARVETARQRELAAERARAAAAAAEKREAMMFEIPLGNASADEFIAGNEDAPPIAVNQL